MDVSRTRAWWALIPAMSLPFGASLFYFVLLSDSEVAKWVYTATKLFTIVWPLLALRWVLRESWPGPLQGLAGHVQALHLGALTGLGIVLLMAALMMTPVGSIVNESAERIREKARSLGILDHYWTFGIFLALIHSLIEEYYWRWFVFGQLRRLLRRVPAHVVAGVAFAAHHVVIATQYFPLAAGVILGGLVGVGGMIWSWMFEHQRTLAGAWFSHVLADLGILMIGHKLLFGSYW